jgi:seryl-tRNA synthetase
MTSTQDRTPTQRTGQDHGLSVLGPGQLGLLRRLDAHLLGWAEGAGATERRYPFLLRPADLDSIDYYENFPHLGLQVSTARADALGDYLGHAPRPVPNLPVELLNDARYNLPSAACYSIYLDLRGRRLAPDGSLHTTIATCFRNENYYDGLQRLLGFSMREIVFVGPAEAAKQHIVDSKARVLQLAADLGLQMTTEVATDPFFDPSGSRAKMQVLFPTKEEFVVDGLAVGSVNYHRNFFGERCDIQIEDGGPAHTSCVAFGLERWLHVLTTAFGDVRTAAEAVADLP